ncbi:MAG TPA: hypothetical protein VFV19_19820 [Candidatus Polarisedimenticolaceae bacterium]|nr:hypothetical protein [Candidatus Polarisedimenticolaceae bacterium]
MKKKPAKAEPKVHVINFSFGSHTYQIDPSRHKVYRRFVEIETSKAATIYSTWRATNA